MLTISAGGVICLPNRDNERDPYLLNSQLGFGRDLLVMTS